MSSFAPLENINTNLIINNDLLLWNSFKSGNSDAFEKLYNNYFTMLGSYGKRLNPDKILVEDAIHDVFVELWRRKEFLSEVDNIKYYLFRAVRNKLIENFKDEHFESSEDINNFLDYLSTLSSEQEIISEENRDSQKKIISLALNNLSKRQQEAVHLRFFDGLSLDEISLIMDLPKQVVKNLLSKSYAILRVSLKNLLILLAFLLN